MSKDPRPPLKTMDRHNAERRAAWKEASDEGNAERRAAWKEASDEGNGIACPSCDKELYDAAPGCVLACFPPKKDVYCPSCGYRGVVLA